MSNGTISQRKSQSQHYGHPRDEDVSEVALQGWLENKIFSGTAINTSIVEDIN